MEIVKLSTTRSKHSVNPRWLVPLIDASLNHHKVLIKTTDGLRHKVEVDSIESYNGREWMFGNDGYGDEDLPYAEGISCVEILVEVNAEGGKEKPIS